MRKSIKCLLLASLLWSVLPCCSSKKEAIETTAPEKVETTEAIDPGKQAAVTENQAEAEQVAVPPLRKPLPFRPLPLKDMRKLEGDKLENAVLSTFSLLSDDVRNEELMLLKESADKGDDAAKEKFVSIVFERPHTDPMYRTAIGYLMSIREFKNPDVLFSRAIMEYSNSTLNPQARGNAIHFFQIAANLNHEKTLDYLVKNPVIGLKDMAFERLNAIYESRASELSPKELYDWAKILEFGPPTGMHKSLELLKRSSDLGYARAQFTLGASLLEKDWNAGYDLVKQAADNGSDEAWLFLANLYAIATFTDNYREANSMGIVTIDEARYAQLQKEASSNGDAKMQIVEAAHKAGGYDEACGLLLGIGASDDNAESTLKARDYAVECIERFIAATPSRDACDRAFDQATYAQEEEFDYEKTYTFEQRSRISQAILSCYLLALEDGEDYPQAEPYVGFSTAMQLATIYSGVPSLTIAPDPAKVFSYILYAASNLDITGQVVLGNDYKSGTHVTKNAPRACFWYQRAAASHICVNFCKDVETANSGTCQACVEASKEVELCKKK